MNKNSKILVTGHKGFVGSNLYSELLGHDFRNVHGYSRNEVDLSNSSEVMSLFKSQKFEYVFMCAAKCGGVQANIDDPFGFLFNNLVVQNNVIHAAIATHVQKALFLGSSCIYPTNSKQPLKEEYILSGPIEPTNEGYSIAKIAGLKLCEFANRMSGRPSAGIPQIHATKFISLMPCNLYGPNDDFDLRNSHVMAALIRKFVEARQNNINAIEIWGTGTARREFLYITDLIKCMMWVMSDIHVTNTFLNVGSGEDITIKDLAYKIAELTGYSGEIVFDPTKPEGMKRRCLDVSKINSMGWKSSTSLSAGITATIDHYNTLSIA